MTHLLRWLIPLCALMGCSGPTVFNHDSLATISFGAPVVRQGYLEIPVYTNNGSGLQDIMVSVCKDISIRHERTIELALYRCRALLGGPGSLPRITIPHIRVPYDGPGPYEVVLIGPENERTDLGTVMVPESAGSGEGG